MTAHLHPTLLPGDGLVSLSPQPSAQLQHNAWAKSFCSLLKEQEKITIPIREASSYKGKPELVISRSEQGLLCADMPFVLIGKFFHCKPTMEVLRKFFLKMGLRGHHNISALDAKHIAIECDLEEDYTRLCSQEGVQIHHHYMRLVKWTPNFRPGFESSIVPVWVQFPLLPLYWFDKKNLFHVARLVGRPLRIDEPTIQRKRLGTARVCIEIDISKPLLEEVFLTITNDVTKEPEERICQTVIYERVPPYCSHCFHLGHVQSHCKVLHPELITKEAEKCDKGKAVESIGNVSINAVTRQDKDGSKGKGVEFELGLVAELEVTKDVYADGLTCATEDLGAEVVMAAAPVGNAIVGAFVVAVVPVETVKATASKTVEVLVGVCSVATSCSDATSTGAGVVKVVVGLSGGKGPGLGNGLNTFIGPKQNTVGTSSIAAKGARAKGKDGDFLVTEFDATTTTIVLEDERAAGSMVLGTDLGTGMSPLSGTGAKRTGAAGKVLGAFNGNALFDGAILPTSQIKFYEGGNESSDDEDQLPKIPTLHSDGEVSACPRDRPKINIPHSQSLALNRSKRNIKPKNLDR